MSNDVRKAEQCREAIERILGQDARIRAGQGHRTERGTGGVRFGEGSLLKPATCEAGSLRRAVSAVRRVFNRENYDTRRTDKDHHA